MKNRLMEAQMKNIKLAMFALALTVSQAQANDNPIINSVESAKDFVLNSQVTNFVVTEYTSLKDESVQGIQQTKEQVDINKDQLVGIFLNVKDAFNYYFNNENQ